MKLDISKKTFILVGILALVAVILVFGVLLPTVNYIKKTNEDADNLYSYLEQKYEQSLKYRVTRQKIREIKENSADFSAHIFRKGDELALITYLENLSAKYGLTQNLTNSNLDKITENHIDLELTLSGDYYRALQYLSELDASDYFLNVEHLQLTPLFSRNGEPGGSANLYLTLGLYASP